jgi:hypothetical protein
MDLLRSSGPFNSALEQIMDESEFERKTLANIEEFGCSVLHIAAEDDLPPFSYSVGITKVSKAPELVVIGLKQPIAHFIVNEYNKRVRSGEQFVSGNRYSDFIEGFEVQAQTVDPSFYSEYVGYNLWLYDGPNFEVLQFIYPTTSGVWPWEPGASEWFRSNQPILSTQSIENNAR